MGRIIKLTESQLRDVVQRVINEQKASPNATAAAKQIWTKLSIAQADDDSAALISAISMIKSVELYTEVVNMMRGASSIGYYKSIVQLLNGELGAYDVPTFKQIQAILKKIGVTITAQIKKAGDGKTDYLETGSIRQMIGPAKPAPVITPPKPGETDPAKPTYRECKGFPLMYGCKQTEVGYVQQCLGLKVDYSFGPATLQALVGYAPMRNGSTPEGLKKQYATIGLSKQEFDLIRTKYCKAKPKPKPKPKPGETPVVDTRTKTDIAPLKAKELKMVPSNLGLTPEQIQAKLQRDLAALQAANTPKVDPARKTAILAQIKDRGFDKVYKGQALTPDEKNWLSSQMGTDPNKDKMKAGGEDEKLRFSNT
jgi:hypothetical protein